MNGSNGGSSFSKNGSVVINTNPFLMRVRVSK